MNDLMSGKIEAFQKALGFAPTIAEVLDRWVETVQVPELALRIDDSPRVTAVKDYAEASGIWCEMRDESGMGASMMGRFTIVDLTTGLTVAHISYNGRVWKGEPEDWNSRTEMLYAP